MVADKLADYPIVLMTPFTVRPHEKRSDLVCCPYCVYMTRDERFSCQLFCVTRLSSKRFPLRVPNQQQTHHVVLLYWSREEKHHYAWVKNLSLNKPQQGTMETRYLLEYEKTVEKTSYIESHPPIPHMTQMGNGNLAVDYLYTLQSTYEASYKRYCLLS